MNIIDPTTASEPHYDAVIAPRKMWESYKTMAYDPMTYDDQLTPQEELEHSSAFYAGIEAAFIVMDYYCSFDDLSADNALGRVEEFRRLNKTTALKQHLDRRPCV